MNNRKRHLIRKIKKDGNCSIFIETGTMYGHTSQWASQFFETVYTIEKNIQLFNSAREKFKNSNVRCLNGDSPFCLSSVLEQTKDNTIFWLDAHWSGGVTSGKEKECQLLEEIKVINDWNHECIILIDDARLFLSPPYEPHNPDHWPSITDIINLLNRVEEKYIVIIHDVIIAVSFSLKPFVERFCVSENTKAWEKRCEVKTNKKVSHLRISLYHFKRFLAKSFHR